VPPASHWRGHLFLFDPRAAATYPADAGWKLLLIVVLLEAVIGPRFHLFGWLGLPMPHPAARVALSLVLALGLVRYFAGVAFAAIGLRRWREWSATEKSYFVQVVVIANVVFAALYAGRLPATSAVPGFWLALATSVAWGFYQEVVYRGLLQTELSRRLGPIAGILLSNLAYTFGPLHFYHFAQPSPWPMLAAIFAIGLFFAVLLHRSRNLWMVAVFHGIGTAWILGINGGSDSN
jgi:membrane protease YdiL (CAAX protease family)